MERVELPTGVTIDGKELYFREKQVKDTKSKAIPIDRYLKRTRSIKGKAFNQDKPLSKLQRVVKTSVYDNKQIKEYEMQEYHDKFTEELYERFQESTLSDVLICIFGCDDQWKTNAEIVDIAAQVNKEKRRTMSFIGANSFSYFLSNFWMKNKCISLFVDRTKNTKGKSGRRVYSHRMSEIGLKIGVHELIMIMNKKIPNDFTKLRLSLSNCRLAAKQNGVSEYEFNKYIEERFNESMGLTGKVTELLDPPVTRTIDDMPLKNVVENVPLGAVLYRSPSEPEPIPASDAPIRPSIDTTGLNDMVQDGLAKLEESVINTPLEPEDKRKTDERYADYGHTRAGTEIVRPEPKSFSKIKFNIKVAFIPITGEIELI